MPYQNKQILPVILAGGSGSRLWPLSRAKYPKQFIKFDGQHSSFQSTFLRIDNFNCQKPLVICHHDHRFLAAEQIREINTKASILLEPEGKNTAPAIALAAFQAIEGGDDPIFLILAADHVIEDTEAFAKAVKKAECLALDDKLVTFGIVANTPETGYGYIKCGERVESSENREQRIENREKSEEGREESQEREAGSSERERAVTSSEFLVSGENKKLKTIEAFIVDQFIEKPDRETAESYLKSGDYFWNSGMFMFKASRYLEVLKQYQPEMYKICQQCIESKTRDLDFIRIDSSLFSSCPSESIDYAVMEPLCSEQNVPSEQSSSSEKKLGSELNNAVAVVPLDAGWNDIGSWSALWEISEKDDKGNHFIGDVLSDKSNDCYVHANEKLVSLVGVEDLVVIDTKDALLVAHKDKVQQVKNIVERLKQSERSEWEIHREVYRPWGKYDSIDFGDRYQVKRITVNAGAKLSVQMHHHRAEHWVVVAGTAKVTNGEETFLVSENESTYIPIGQIHALENPGKVPLELIEVQTGSYLGEDDIVRLEDRYNRS